MIQKAFKGLKVLLIPRKVFLTDIADRVLLFYDKFPSKQQNMASLIHSLSPLSTDRKIAQSPQENARAGNHQFVTGDTKNHKLSKVLIPLSMSRRFHKSCSLEVIKRVKL